MIVKGTIGQIIFKLSIIRKTPYLTVLLEMFTFGSNGYTSS